MLSESTLEALNELTPQQQRRVASVLHNYGFIDALDARDIRVRHKAHTVDDENDPVVQLHVLYGEGIFGENDFPSNDWREEQVIDGEINDMLAVRFKFPHYIPSSSNTVRRYAYSAMSPYMIATQVHEYGLVRLVLDKTVYYVSKSMTPLYCGIVQEGKEPNIKKLAEATITIYKEMPTKLKGQKVMGSPMGFIVEGAYAMVNPSPSICKALGLASPVPIACGLVSVDSSPMDSVPAEKVLSELFLEQYNFLNRL